MVKYVGTLRDPAPVVWSNFYPQVVSIGWQHNLAHSDFAIIYLIFLQFFLRSNYLEMHRQYGCSSNPSRVRPMCDLCGKKFCQPQKLKIHLKRMHGGKFEN